MNVRPKTGHCNSNDGPIVAAYERPAPRCSLEDWEKRLPPISAPTAMSSRDSSNAR